MPANWKGGIGVKITKENAGEIKDTAMLLADVEVLVGFPEDTTARPTDPDNPGGDITNAAIAYINDNGAPERNIPPRPFMLPGVDSVKDQLAEGLAKTMRAVFKGGDKATVEKGLHRVGFTAKIAIQRTIQAGLSPALSERTLRDRMKRGRQGAAQELDRRWDNQEPSSQFAKPLFDTGELLKSVNYAIRSRKKRSK